MTEQTNTKTITEIAHVLGMKSPTVGYILRSRGVKAVRRVGRADLYGPDAVELVQKVLDLRRAAKALMQPTGRPRETSEYEKGGGGHETV